MPSDQRKWQTIRNNKTNPILVQDSLGRRNAFYQAIMCEFSSQDCMAYNHLSVVKMLLAVWMNLPAS